MNGRLSRIVPGTGYFTTTRSAGIADAQAVCARR